jgi:serine/threonine-protein kinase
MTQRYATAREFAVAIERCTGIASSTETGEWVEAMAHVTLSERAERVAEIESSSSTTYDANTMEGLHTSVAAGPKEQPAGGPQQPSQAASGVRANADPPVSQASQMSSISVSRPGDASPPRRNTVLYAGILGAAFLLLSVAILVGAFTLRSGTPSTAGAAGTATSEPKARPSATVAVTPPPSATVTATPQDTASGVAIGDIPAARPTVKPTAGSGTRPAVVTTAHPTAPVTTFPTAPATTTTVAPPPAVNCDPPYTLDASGHKKWKPECLK